MVANRAAFRQYLSHVQNVLNQRRVILAFAAWRLDRWHPTLAAAISALEYHEPRRPIGSPTGWLFWEDTPPEQPPPFVGGLIRPPNEPRKPGPRRDRSARHGKGSQRRPMPVARSLGGLVAQPPALKSRARGPGAMR